jgi:hypothetical protein
MWRTDRHGAVRSIVTLLIMSALIPSGHLAVIVEAAGPPQSTHRLFGSKSADQARRTVDKLGIGAHVDVTVTWGDRLHGEIQEIGDDYFVLILDGSGVRADVLYEDVQQLGPIILKPIQRTPRESTSLKVAGVAAMVAYLAFMAIYNHP